MLDRKICMNVLSYKSKEISRTIAGYSLGAALSNVNAADIVRNGHSKSRIQPNKTFPVTAFHFGSQLVGDSNLRDTLHSMNDLHILSIHNALDIIPHLLPVGYTDIGVELLIDGRISSFLNGLGDFVNWHNLELVICMQ